MHSLRMVGLLHVVLLMLGVFTGIAAAQTQPVEDARPIEADSKNPPATAPANTLPSLFFVGDSTMHSNNGPRGYAQEIGAFFDKEKINIVDRAIGGRSSRTFIHEGRWDKVLSEIKPGDYVIIAFGHNDNGDYKNPAAKGRPSLRSNGDETAEAVKGDGVTMETIHSYGWYMRKYATDAKAKGATVILATMVPHKDWKDGKISRGERATFIKWTQDAAERTGSLFLDVNEYVALAYEKLGPEKVEPLFHDAKTHTTPEGAKFIAGVVVSGLKAMEPNPLAAFLNQSGQAVPAAEKLK